MSSSSSSNQGLFGGLCFALNSHSSFSIPDSELVELIEENGGQFLRNLTQHATHLVCSNYNNSFRITMAEKHNVTLISDGWIIDCVKQGKLLDESNYRLDKSTKKKAEQKLEKPHKFKILLKTDFSDDEITLEEDGTIYLGRGALEIDDKRCSRKQVEIVVEDNCQKISLISRGKNPSMLFKKTKEPIIMEKDIPYQIEDGDSFGLIMEDLKIFVLKEDLLHPASSKKRKLPEEEKVTPVTKKQTIEKTETFSTSKNKKSQSDGSLSIAFPPISTHTYGFDNEIAAKIGCESIQEFLKKYNDPRIKIYVVDISNSDTLKKFQKRISGDSRMIVAVSDITQLGSNGMPCKYIVNATNPRFSPRGSGVNKAIFAAAGEQLHSETIKKYKYAEPGNSYPIKLPNSSPLFQKEQVEYVIHSLGPNMNPNRPNCLNGNYEVGSALLKKTYTSVLESFAELAGLQPTTENKEHKRQEEPRNAFQIMMKSSTTGNKREKEDEKNPNKMSGWNNALKKYLLNPEENSDSVFYFDSNLVVIKDKYPKSSHHLLVLPRKIIDRLSHLTKEHIPIIESMVKVGTKISEQLSQKHGLQFKIGFHALPSMSLIHMHIISQDFESDFLKTKKHWNSFTTDFFIEADRFLQILKENGKVQFDKEKYSEMLKKVMKCHKCSKEFLQLPRLKEHIKTCN